MSFNHAVQVAADLRVARWTLLYNCAVAIVMGCTMVGLAMMCWSPLWAVPIVFLANETTVNVGARPRRDRSDATAG